MEDRLSGADPVSLGMVELDLDRLAARGGRALEKRDRKTRRADDGAAHEHGVGHKAIAETLDDRLAFQKIAVGLRCERGRVVDPHPHRLTRPPKGGSCH